MLSNNDKVQMKRINEILQDASDYAKVITDNITWKFDLPDYQRLLLDDAYVLEDILKNSINNFAISGMTLE